MSTRVAVKTVTATEWLGVAKSGGCYAQRMRDHGGAIWIVKFWNNPQGPKVGVNELVSALLGRRVGLEVPEPAIIEISPSLAAYIAQECPRLAQYACPGRHFASCYIRANVLTNDDLQKFHRNRRYRAQVENFVQTLIAFDQFVYNCDRNNNAAHVLFRKGRHRVHFYPIDHSRCFTAPWWSTGRLAGLADQRASLRGKKFLSWFCQYLDWQQLFPFFDACGRIQQITGSELQQMLAAVPEEWWVSPTERDALLRFLEIRKAELGSIMSDVEKQLRGRCR